MALVCHFDDVLMTRCLIDKKPSPFFENYINCLFFNCLDILMEEPVIKPASNRVAALPKTAAGKAVRRKTATKAPPAKKSVTAPKKAAAPKTAVAIPKKAAAPKSVKLKKTKLVRDSFTLPKDERALLVQLKQRATKLAHPSKKSELLRAGIKALSSMTDRAFLAAINAIPSIKTGRPTKKA